MLPEGKYLHFSFHFYFLQNLNISFNVPGEVFSLKDTSADTHFFVRVFQESRSLLLEALHLSKKEGFCLGVKLVRGAYMDKERKLAEKEGRPDPIHQSWEDTNDRWI